VFKYVVVGSKRRWLGDIGLPDDDPVMKKCQACLKGKKAKSYSIILHVSPARGLPPGIIGFLRGVTPGNVSPGEPGENDTDPSRGVGGQSSDDKLTNDQALKQGNRLQSDYDDERFPGHGDTTIRIVTAADRSSTSVLFPDAP
jgi:hypothetical protein